MLKVSPNSPEAHNNYQNTTSGVLSSQNHKQRQTMGGLFSKTIFVTVFLIHSWWKFLQNFLRNFINSTTKLWKMQKHEKQAF